MRKVVRPGSNRADTRMPSPLVQKTFGLGIVKDGPASELQGGLADGYNVTCFDRFWEGRGGSRLFTPVLLPAMPGRTGYSAHKTGDQIISDSGNIFLATDVGRRWYWADTGDYDDIVDYIGQQNVVVDNSGNRGIVPGCWIQGADCLWKWHSSERKWIVQVGQMMYQSQWDIPAWDQSLCISNDQAMESIGEWAELKEYGFVFNSNGLFKMAFDNPALYYKTNIDPPSVAVVSVLRGNLSKARYRYLYSAARLTEQGNIVDRNSPSRIELETGTTARNADGIDYGEVNTDVAIGDGSHTYGMLTCGTLTGTSLRASTWAAITNGVANFNVNGIGVNKISIDFTGVTTMKQVAELIQAGLRDFFPDAVCYYDTDFFVVTSGDVEDSIITWATTPTPVGGETNIAALMLARNGDGGALSTELLTVPKVIGELWLPVIPNTNPAMYQWHFTHYPVYRTKDLEALDVSDIRRSKYNDPNDFVWVADVRIAAAFYGNLAAGVFTASRGEFEPTDVGATIKIDNGNTYTITDYLTPTTAQLTGGASGGPFGAAIGNGRVIRGSITAGVLTRTVGGNFGPLDLRKAVLDSDGYRWYITEVIGINSVRIHDSTVTKSTQGFTIDPTHRSFCDTFSDEVLRARAVAWPLTSRFYEAVPNCNVGSILPGFVVCARRNDKKVYYCEQQQERDYFIGSHNPRQVNDQVQGAIQKMIRFPTVVAIICSAKTYAFQIGVTSYASDAPGSSYAVLPPITPVDEAIGCVDIGSIAEIESGLVEILTNEPGGFALRHFNGISYGADDMLICQESGFGRYREDVEDTKGISASVYHGNIGYLNWRKRK